MVKQAPCQLQECRKISGLRDQSELRPGTFRRRDGALRQNFPHRCGSGQMKERSREEENGPEADQLKMFTELITPRAADVDVV